MTARHSRGDSGQVTVLVALLMIPLLAISGLVIDVGYAYFTQRTLQAQAELDLHGRQNVRKALTCGGGVAIAGEPASSPAGLLPRYAVAPSAAVQLARPCFSRYCWW